MKFLVEQNSWVNDIVTLASARISEMYKKALAPLDDEDKKRAKRALAALLCVRNVQLKEVADFEDLAERIDSWLSSNRHGNKIASVVINDVAFSTPVRILSKEEVKDSSEAFSAAGLLGFVLACSGKDLEYVTMAAAEDGSFFEDAAGRPYPEEDKVYAHHPSVEDDYPEFEPRSLLVDVKWEGSLSEAQAKAEWAARLAASAFGQLLKAACKDKLLTAEGVGSYYFDEPYADSDDPFAADAFCNCSQHYTTVYESEDGLTVLPKAGPGQLWRLVVEREITLDGNIVQWSDTIPAFWRADSPLQSFMAACRYYGARNAIFDMLVANDDAIEWKSDRSFYYCLTHSDECRVSISLNKKGEKQVVHLAHGGQLNEGMYLLWCANTEKIDLTTTVRVLKPDTAHFKTEKEFKLHLQNSKTTVAEGLIESKYLKAAPSDADSKTSLLCYTFNMEDI